MKEKIDFMSKKQVRKDLRISYAIVCEGQTEWYYFNHIKQEKRYRFSITSDFPGHSDFKSIIKKAKRILQDKEYSAVFCVFDLDKVKTDGKIDELIKECESIRNKRIIPILSFPCIEIWFLFHFWETYSSRYYENYDAIEKALRRYVPNYCKEREYLANKSFFKLLQNENKSVKARQFSKRSVIDIENISMAINTSFTEIGIFLEFLDKCSTCKSNTKQCQKCYEEYFASIVAKKIK